MAKSARAATTENSVLSRGAKDVLSHEEGLLVGVSAGAAMVAALEVANQLSSGVVVTIFPDRGGK
jgi:cysteine synthase